MKIHNVVLDIQVKEALFWVRRLYARVEERALQPVDLAPQAHSWVSDDT